MEQEKRLEILLNALEESGIRQLAQVMNDRKRLLLRSFLSGIFRGLGAAIGFSVLGALALFVIKWIFGIDFLR
ncbi:MAG: DUF5665 domain-containing protein [bacterium]|nr:DUF5665 domain-containing protein [bacterium]